MKLEGTTGNRFTTLNRVCGISFMCCTWLTLDSQCLSRLIFTLLLFNHRTMYRRWTRTNYITWSFKVCWTLSNNIYIHTYTNEYKTKHVGAFSAGPPGTGKTTMANLVAKVMLKMKLLKTDKVIVSYRIRICWHIAVPQCDFLEFLTVLVPSRWVGVHISFNIRFCQVVFVNNALELLAGYSGQTSGKVDAKVL